MTSATVRPARVTGDLATGARASGASVIGDAATGDAATGDAATGDLATGALATAARASGDRVIGAPAPGALASGAPATGARASGALASGALATAARATGARATGARATGARTEDGSSAGTRVGGAPGPRPVPLDAEHERPYAWVLPPLPPEAERVAAALQRRGQSRGGWWRRVAAGRLGPLTALDREMAAVRELRELATAVLDRRGGNRYGTVVPVSEALLLLDDPTAWRELLALAGLDHPGG